MPEVRLETERLIVRDWQGDGDWAAFIRHTNNPRVMRWLGPPMDVSAQVAMRQAASAIAH